MNPQLRPITVHNLPLNAVGLNDVPCNGLCSPPEHADLFYTKRGASPATALEVWLTAHPASDVQLKSISPAPEAPPTPGERFFLNTTTDALPGDPVMTADRIGWERDAWIARWTIGMEEER